MNSKELAALLLEGNYKDIECVRLTARNVLINHGGGRTMINRNRLVFDYTQYTEELETR